MRKSYIREKRTLCGDTYQAVGIYPVTDQEHRQRGKKRKESDRGPEKPEQGRQPAPPTAQGAGQF